MRFIGTYADLSGVTVGNFTVLELARRDRNKAPLWRVICKRCRRDHVFTHAKLTNRLETRSADETLFCQNEACPVSFSRTVRTETLADIRRAERREREEAERLAKAQRDRAAKDAADRAEKERALAPMRSDWSRYVQTQILAGKPANQILNFDRWLQIGDAARTRIMELVAQTESQA